MGIPINEEEKLDKFFQEYLKSKGASKALKKLEDFESKSFQISSSIQLKILNQLFVESKHQEAIDFFGKLVKKYKEHETFLVSIMMDNFTNKNLIDESESLFNSFMNKNIQMDDCIFNSLLKLLLKKKEFEKLEETFNQQDTKHLKNIESYQIIIDAFFQQDDLKNVAKYYSEMKKVNLKPNYGIYLKFIEYFSEKGSMQKCEQILNEMVQNGIPPTLEIFNAFLYGYIDNPTKFDEIEQTIKKLKIKITKRTFNLLLLGYITQKNEIKIEKLMQNMHFISIDKKNYLKLIQFYTIELKLPNEQINKKMMNQIPQGLSFEQKFNLIEILLKTSNFKFINRIIENDDEKVGLLNKLLKLYLRDGRVEEMSKLLMDMVGKKFKVDKELYEDCLLELMAKDDLENAMKIFGWIEGLYGAHPRKELYLHMIRKYFDKKETKIASDLLNEMESVHH